MPKSLWYATMKDIDKAFKNVRFLECRKGDVAISGKKLRAFQRAIAAASVISNGYRQHMSVHDKDLRSLERALVALNKQKR